MKNNLKDVKYYSVYRIEKKKKHENDKIKLPKYLMSTLYNGFDYKPQSYSSSINTNPSC